MFCPKCGEKLPDDSKFCSACGEKLASATLEVQEEQKTNDDSAPDVSASQINITKPDLEQVKKKINSKKIIGIAAAVVVIIVIAVSVLGLKTLFFSSGSGNVYAYLSNGRYELITNLNKEQIIEIDSSKSDVVRTDMLDFSPDGKYIYYYTKYDDSSETGTLCRAEYGKLKADSSKNDKYIEVIAGNVSLGFRFLDDGSITYISGDDTLYYFNGEEPIQIVENVSYYYTDGSEKLVYVTGETAGADTDEYTLYTMYGVTLSDIDNKIELASDFDNIYSADDFDNILYTKEEDDFSETLYVVGFTKESEKLAEKVSFSYDWIEGHDRIYFTAENGTMLHLYDFIEDSYAEADAGITEPKYDDFSIPSYSYDMVYGSDLAESDYDELYTTCTKPLYWYGESSWNSYSMESALDVDWGDNNDGIHAATQNFIDKFAGSADENGYILVTDEVKAALKEIQKCSDNPEKEEQWLWLCYNKYQSGTTTDYEAYYAAWDKWYEVSDRIAVRKELQNKENDFAVKTLYCFEKGKLTAINENVLNVSHCYGDSCLIFNTTDLITEKGKIEDMSSAISASRLFDIENTAENYVIFSDGTSGRMSVSASETFAEAAKNNSYVALYFTSKEVYMNEYVNDSEWILSVAPIDGGVVGDFTVVDDGASAIIGLEDSGLYYMNNYYENNGLNYCDLYFCGSGSSTRLAKDIMLGAVDLYRDGVMLAYTGGGIGYGHELTMIDAKGETTVIGDDVTQYIRINESMLLYISGGDLYSYDGKEKKLVRSGVERIWSKNSMEDDKIIDMKYSLGLE